MEAAHARKRERERERERKNRGKLVESRQRKLARPGTRAT